MIVRTWLEGRIVPPALPAPSELRAYYVGVDGIVWSEPVYGLVNVETRRVGVNEFSKVEILSGWESASIYPLVMEDDRCFNVIGAIDDDISYIGIADSREMDGKTPAEHFKSDIERAAERYRKAGLVSK